MWRWAIESQMTSSWEVQASLGTSTDSDTDMIKSILVDTNPLLLAVTVIVSLLHSVFDFLAFRNDISFWRARKNLEGLSVRTVGLGVFFQGVIMLYLFDYGNDDNGAAATAFQAPDAATLPCPSTVTARNSRTAASNAVGNGAAIRPRPTAGRIRPRAKSRDAFICHTLSTPTPPAKPGPEGGGGSCAS
jgi:hypothetical protein